jgi:hypothetical protein
MTAPAGTLETVIPDLTAIPLEQVDKLGGNVLAHAIALYRALLKANGEPLSSFNARI